MKSKKRFFAVILVLSASGLLTACGGGGGGGGSSSSSGATITLTGFTDSSVSGLAYNSTVSNAASGSVVGSTTLYTREWNDSTGNNIATMTYYDGGTTEQYLGFNVMANALTTANVYYVDTGSSILCHVSGTTVTYPTCSSMGITVDRVNGTLSLVSTPALNPISGAAGTMSGSLTFTAF